MPSSRCSITATAAMVDMNSDTIAPVLNTPGTMSRAGSHTIMNTSNPRPTLRVSRACCSYTSATSASVVGSWYSRAIDLKPRP